MSEIIDRIKYLRQDLNLNQELFANKLNLKRNSIAQIESGRRNPSERTLLDICKEFKINYLWLSEGLGEMRTETSDDIFDEIKVEYNLSDDDLTIVKDYMSLEKAQRKRLRTYIKALVDAEKKEGD